MSDNIKHPSHYCKAGVECIDAIKAIVSTITDPFEAYCTGNIIKYIWRWHDKNGVEDLNKAEQYIDFIERYREGKSTTVKTSSAPTQAEYEEMFEGEEDVSEPVEPVKGKYEWLSNEDMRLTFLCQKIDCRDCPLFLPTGGVHGVVCREWVEQNPDEARRIMLEWLEKEGEQCH